MKATLEKWGYKYNYSRSGVEITRKPELPEEKLKEILIRKLNLDVQINAYDFACFLCAFTDIGSFDSMPWEERAIQMQLKYNVNITDRSLRNWCKKLIEKDLIQKCGRETYWKTEYFGKEKHRTKVTADDEEMAQYFQKKEKHLRQLRKKADDLELLTGEKSVWRATYKKLWREFQCCYYSCRGLEFNAIGEDYIFDIYELAQEIAAPPLRSPLSKPKSIMNKEEFHESWFQKHNV